jgi:hypothetical protein
MRCISGRRRRMGTGMPEIGSGYSTCRGVDSIDGMIAMTVQ